MLTQIWKINKNCTIKDCSCAPWALTQVLIWKKKTNNTCGALLHMPYHFSYQWHGPKSKSDTTRPINKRRIVEGWRELQKWCQSKEEGAGGEANTNNEEIKADDSIARFLFFYF